MALRYNECMQQDYSHFKITQLDKAECEAIVVNALAYMRDNGKQEPQYPFPQLFQATAFMERVVIMHARAERESPPRKITDEEVYTEDFATKLEYFTGEYIAALAGCIPAMSATHSSVPDAAMIASCFLNPLDSPHRAIPMNSTADRSEVCEHALMLSLTYSQLNWTQEMYDALVEWYPPALLLCADNNIPPMANPAVRTALEWAMSLDEKPKRRFMTMRDQFDNMVKPSPEAAAHLDLPAEFSPS